MIQSEFLFTKIGDGYVGKIVWQFQLDPLILSETADYTKKYAQVILNFFWVVYIGLYFLFLCCTVHLYLLRKLALFDSSTIENMDIICKYHWTNN